MIALKTILKEIDPLAFDESLKIKPEDAKQFKVIQDEESRRKMDKKWDDLNK